MVEFAGRMSGDVEITYFGLHPAAVGNGLGRRLMAAALELAWSSATRVWLHTCNFDHPAASRFYQSCGFTPYANGFEIMDDPRLDGSMPRVDGTSRATDPGWSPGLNWVARSSGSGGQNGPQTHHDLAGVRQEHHADRQRQPTHWRGSMVRSVVSSPACSATSSDSAICTPAALARPSRRLATLMARPITDSACVSL